MITPTDNYPDIVEAKVIDHKTGEEEDLIQKPDYKKKFSACFFKKTRIQYKEYEIQLRFDFSDKDRYGDPTLDVDFYKNGKEIRLEPHHILKTRDDNLAAYRFEFDDIEMILKLKLTKVITLACKVYIVKPD